MLDVVKNYVKQKTLCNSVDFYSSEIDADRIDRQKNEFQISRCSSSSSWATPVKVKATAGQVVGREGKRLLFSVFFILKLTWTGRGPGVLDVSWTFNNFAQIARRFFFCHFIRNGYGVCRKGNHVTNWAETVILPFRPGPKWVAEMVWPK